VMMLPFPQNGIMRQAVFSGNSHKSMEVRNLLLTQGESESYVTNYCVLRFFLAVDY
jgi:hypothetical protein